jgi:preprotein translocase subunit SecG
MMTFLAVVHILLALALVCFVLLQDPKGGALGVFSGGSSSNSFFGSSGASNFLTTTTRWIAILFAASCLGLTFMTSHKGGSVMDQYTPPPASSSAPATPPAAPAPAEQPASKEPDQSKSK